jgi:hypothetical protein
MIPLFFAEGPEQSRRVLRAALALNSNRGLRGFKRMVISWEGSTFLYRRGRGKSLHVDGSRSAGAAASDS